MADRLPRYRTGDARIDDQIHQIVDGVASAENRDIIFEMITSAVRLARENVDRGDLKLVNAALKELRYSFHVFGPYRGIKKCSIFGSARTQPDDPGYIAARDFGAAIAKRDWMVMTGAGPGIMAAGLEGAGTENSFGINIQLPFEASANEFIEGDPKLINFRYFFTRKVTFMKETHGYALLPGGFGTMDEAFELLTLMQTGKTFLAPIVLLDPAGSTYWERWVEFVKYELLDNKLISEEDLCLVKVTSDIEEAVEEICGFYRCYHSTRYVGQRLVLRLNHDISDSLLAEINNEFADLVESGAIERTEVSRSEIDDYDVVDLPRLAFRFNRAKSARLRQLVDHLNTCSDA